MGTRLNECSGRIVNTTDIYMYVRHNIVMKSIFNVMHIVQY